MKKFIPLVARRPELLLFALLVCAALLLINVGSPRTSASKAPASQGSGWMRSLGGDANPDNDTGNGGITDPSADVSLVKTLDTAGPFVPGQSISYTITVANDGPSTATSIQVTDTPTNLTITNVSGSGCAALPCTIASLASGANTTITVTATITTVGAFDNSATAAATESDPNPSNNTDNTGNGGSACSLNPVVTSNADSGGGTLRDAIIGACTGATITFDMNQVTSPITLTTGELLIDKNLTINGPTSIGLTISGNNPNVNSSRVFNVGSGKSLTFSNLTIANGKASQGGGILNGGTLTITNSTLNNNTTTNGADVNSASAAGNSGNGGAIYSTGSLTLINSTLSGNQTGRGGNNSGAGNGGNSGSGGGIYNTGTLKLTNSTVANNKTGSPGQPNPNPPDPNNPTGTIGTAGPGGGIFNSGGTLTLNNTIVATNVDGFLNPNDINGAVDASSRSNLIGAGDGMSGISDGSNGNQVGTAAIPLSPHLGALADNGGPTMTHLPDQFSTAIDGGDNTKALDQNDIALVTDQRGAGFPRKIDGGKAKPDEPTVDIGAVEVTAAAAPAGADLTVTKSADRDTVLPDRDLTYTIVVTNGGADAATNASLTDNLPQVTTNTDPDNPTYTSTTFVSLTSPAGWSCSTPSVGSGGSVSCSKASFAGVSQQTFTLVVHIPSNAMPNSGDPFFTNVVTAEADNETNTENNSGFATTQLFSCITDPIVTKNTDSGPGTLRQAIADACVGSTITFDMTQFASPITLTTAELLINKDLIVTGPGANLLTIQRSTAGGTPNFRVFNIQSGFMVNIFGLTIANGRTPDGTTNLDGGGILNAGSLTLTNTVINGNHTGNGTSSSTPGGAGGGIRNNGMLNLVSSTVSNNVTGDGNSFLANGGSGGGISNNGTLSIAKSSISTNQTGIGNSGGGNGGGGAGLHNTSSGLMTVIETTVNGNQTGAGGIGINPTIPNGGRGGGIYNSGSLNLLDSTIRNNSSAVGGIAAGIENDSTGTSAITNTTISGNTTPSGSAGIEAAGSVTLINSTVTNNRSDSDNNGSEHGGGLFGEPSAVVILKNTIVAGNFRGSGSTRDDVAGTINSSSSFNLIGDGTNMTGINNGSQGNQVGSAGSPINAMLGALASNGGSTQTHLLLPASPAINTGSNANLPADTFDLDNDSNTAEPLPVDQRGFTRIVGSTVDIGAVETNYAISATAGSGQNTNVNTAFAIALKATVTESGTAQNNVQVTFTAPASGASGTFPGPLTTAVASTNSSGVATAPTFTANATGGSYNVGASIGPSLPTATFALTNNKLNQTITFASIANKTFGDADFGVSPTASSSLAVSLAASGNCTVTTPAPGTVHLTGAGNCTITASQAGDVTYNAATDVQQSFTIAKAATTTAVSAAPNPSNSGQNVTFTATVTSAAGTPTGTVQFKDGGTNLGAAQSLNGSGVATFSTTALTPGVHTITADYSGDVNFLTSSGTLSGGQQVGSIIRFSSSTYNTTENAGFTTITVQRAGDLSQAVSVDYTTPDDSTATTVLPCSTANGVASPRCDFETTLGTLRWAAGDGSSKTFTVLINQDNFVEGPETLTLTLSNLTGGAGFPAPGATTSTATLTITDDVTEPAGNPIDDTDTFVRQHYRDFLNREPDPSGLAFWKDNIDKCNDPARRPTGMSVAQCFEVQHINTSAAFFLSIEFQNTGYFVERVYKAGFGDISPPTVPVPVRFTNFITDTQQVGNGVIVGVGSWQTQLDNNKTAYAQAFVQRAAFLSRYPGSTSATAFVDGLNGNAGNVLTDSERSALISELSPSPADPVLRASVLKKIADNATLQQREFNRAFVLLEYFGYLRRNPDAAPEPALNFAGYNFWLNKLNLFNGNYIDAEMVKAFLSSAEYRRRFGP